MHTRSIAHQRMASRIHAGRIGRNPAKRTTAYANLDEPFQFTVRDADGSILFVAPGKSEQDRLLVQAKADELNRERDEKRGTKKRK